jgi:hypothetical protein
LRRPPPAARHPRAALGDTVAGVPARPVTVRLNVDARPVASSTRLIELGGYQLAIGTVVLSTELPIEVHSSYLGHPGTPTRAVHLTIVPERAETHVVEHEHHQLPVTHARERCLLDHLQTLVELASDLGHTVSVELPDHAVT